MLLDTSSVKATSYETTVKHANNFNLLRFIFASLVILSHSFEIIDGDRHREILTRIFGTITLGELSVDGFFVLSGFLITQSWEKTPDLLNFFKKRILRIYPAFIVASLFSIFIVGVLGSSNPQKYMIQLSIFKFFKNLIILNPPAVPPVFIGQPYPDVNASMWSISYEFRAYLLVALFGFCGFFKQKKLWLLLTTVILLMSLTPNTFGLFSFRGSNFLYRNPVRMIPLLAFFFSGGCFYLFSDRIHYKTPSAFIAALILLPCLLNSKTAQIALVICGSYILFWFAFSQFSILNWFNKFHDISYGVYLYGWPIQKLLLWYIPSLSPQILFLLSLLLACVSGFLSWHIVENKFLRLKK